jgi:hypothetical protein
VRFREREVKERVRPNVQGSTAVRIKFIESSSRLSDRVEEVLDDGIVKSICLLGDILFFHMKNRARGLLVSLNF